MGNQLGRVRFRRAAGRTVQRGVVLRQKNLVEIRRQDRSSTSLIKSKIRSKVDDEVPGVTGLWYSIHLPSEVLPNVSIMSQNFAAKG